MDTVIIVDSSSDLPLKYIEENNIPTVGLTCHLDDKDYIDDFGKTLTYEYFYKRIREGAKPSTSQVNVYQFTEIFKKYVSQGKSIIYLGFSSKLSGTVSSANTAKGIVLEEYKNADITIIDTKSACIGEGLLVYYAYEMLKAGRSKEEIINWVEKNKYHVHHWFIVEDLQHLKRGGRISAAKAAVGTLLQIKPIIYIYKDGGLYNEANARGRKKAIKTLVDKFEECGIDNENQVIGISHGDCLEDALYLEKIITQRFKIGKVFINHVGPVIASHTGSGMLSLCFIGKERSK